MVPDLKANPLDNDDMARLMAALGPFEQNPHVAVAVSGGADSMALTLLADAWARQMGGKVTALTVDHGLRAESQAEAKQVSRWLSSRRIDHRVLNWSGSKPATGLQAAARTARYQLMGDWCRDAGVLHLLLAHHKEDQAETFLLRLNRDSGIDGLAAMAGIVEKADMRLLRPMLDVSKDRLRATLKKAGQSWIEDPSNENTAFERVRIRKSFAELEAVGLSVQALVDTSRRMARARIALEAHASDLLARSCCLEASGYGRIDGATLFGAADEISLRAIGRTLMCIGGSDYSPRLPKLERLHEKMKAAFRDENTSWKGATLGRCRILPFTEGSKNIGFLVCRENRSLPAPISARTAVNYDWDKRFQLRLKNAKGLSYQGVSLQALGKDGWARLIRERPEIGACPLPLPVRATLPVLVDEGGIIDAPYLDYRRYAKQKDAPGFERAVFHPKQTLSGTGFVVAQ